MRRWLVLALLAGLPVGVAGQSVVGSVSGVTGRAPQPVKPYTMTQRLTYERRYADGLSSTQTTELVVMRDAQGRTRNERTLPEQNPTKYIRDGRVSHMAAHGELRLFNVNDPVDGVSMNWTEGPGSQLQINLTHLLKPEPRAGAVGVARSTPAKAPTAETQGGDELTAEVTTEKLGTRAIQGVIATGTRTTTKYSAGVSGMNREFTTIAETWVAEDYHMVIESTTDDPRNGKQVTTLVSFVAGDPDPAMFKAPAGAKVTETVQMADPAEKPESERVVR